MKSTDQSYSVNHIFLLAIWLPDMNDDDKEEVDVKEIRAGRGEALLKSEAGLAVCKALHQPYLNSLMTPGFWLAERWRRKGLRPPILT